MYFFWKTACGMVRYCFLYVLLSCPGSSLLFFFYFLSLWYVIRDVISVVLSAGVEVWRWRVLAGRSMVRRGCRPVLTATGPGCGAHRGRVEPPLWCERIYVQLRVRYWGVGQHRFSCLFVTFGRLRVVVPCLCLSYPRTETGVCVAPLLYRWVLLWHSWANCATNFPTARSNNLLVGCFSPSSMNRNYRPANSLLLNNVTFIRTGYGTTHQSSK